jgi:hypothetical protein
MAREARAETRLETRAPVWGAMQAMEATAAMSL